MFEKTKPERKLLDQIDREHMKDTESSKCKVSHENRVKAEINHKVLLSSKKDRGGTQALMNDVHS